MKKLLIVSLVLVFALGLMGSVVGASPWDMWHGDLFNTNPSSRIPSDYPDAGGRVILNYDKEQESYMVNIQAYGLKLAEEYIVYIQTGNYGTSAHRYKIGEFIADIDGSGSFYLTEVSPENLKLDGVSPRVIIWEKYGYWVLNTSDANNDSLKPIGSKRGK